jgi:hypothetical protein
VGWYWICVGISPRITINEKEWEVPVITGITLPGHGGDNQLLLPRTPYGTGLVRCHTPECPVVSMGHSPPIPVWPPLWEYCTGALDRGGGRGVLPGGLYAMDT